MMPGQNKSWTESAQMLSKPDSDQMNYVPVHTKSGPTAQMNYDPAQMHYAPGQMMSGPAVPHQNYGTPRVVIETNIKPLRFYKALFGLAITQLILAVISVAFGLAAFFYDTDFDADWSGVWVAAAYIVASSCGLGSLRIPNGYRCLLVSYFVLLVISIVLTPVLIAWSSVWVSDSQDYYGYNCYNYYDCFYGQVTVELALNSVLIIIGIAEMILGVISAAFLCCNWHCGQCCGVCCGCKQNNSVETPYENHPKY
jgi:hypothetical protein